MRCSEQALPPPPACVRVKAAASFYGPDSIEPHRRAVGYVDRILKGEKPSGSR